METGALVLWDLDLALLDPAGFGHRMVVPTLAELLGRQAATITSDVPFAGRTDRAILADLVEANGAAAHRDPRLLSAFLDAFAHRCEAHSDELRGGGGGPLPGAYAAVRVLAG